MSNSGSKSLSLMMGALGGHPKSLPSSGAAPTSLGRIPGKSQKLPNGEFWISSRNLLSGVSLARGATGGVGVDERIEGAAGKSPGFMLLDVDQVEQAAQVRPLVKPHHGVAIFDDSNQAPDEIDAVGTVITLAVTSVNLYGDRLVHAFSSARRSGRDGGKDLAEPRGYRNPTTPSVRRG